MLEHAAVKVSGNASRYFSYEAVAMEQPHGRLGLAVFRQGNVFNAPYRAELIRYDPHYLATSCGFAAGG